MLSYQCLGIAYLTSFPIHSILSPLYPDRYRIIIYSLQKYSKIPTLQLPPPFLNQISKDLKHINAQFDEGKTKIYSDIVEETVI